MRQRVLCVVAHPDDETLGVGATLALHAEAGSEVTVLIMSEGEDEKLATTPRCATRRECALQAAEAMGVTRVEFHDFPDQRLDAGQMAVVEGDLGLVDHVEPLLFERAFEAAEKPGFTLAAHDTSVAFNSVSFASRSSRRTGFSIGPAMVRPSASPRRKADSSTRRSKPLTISTGAR